MSTSIPSKSANPYLLLAGIAVTAILLWRLSSSRSYRRLPDPQKELEDDDDIKKKKKNDITDTEDDTKTVETRDETLQESTETVKTTSAATSSSPDEPLDEKAMHQRIEELDKAGKSLFQKKQYLEAAQLFTEALDLIDQHNMAATSSHLARQLITLLNNRSAMYEKANLPELALEDCVAILEREEEHDKARKRKLRVLELLHRYKDALTECCAIQLLFMKANRHALAMNKTPDAPLDHLRGARKRPSTPTTQSANSNAGCQTKDAAIVCPSSPPASIQTWDATRCARQGLFVTVSYFSTSPIATAKTTRWPARL